MESSSRGASSVIMCLHSVPSRRAVRIYGVRVCRRVIYRFSTQSEHHLDLRKPRVLNLCASRTFPDLSFSSALTRRTQRITRIGVTYCSSRVIKPFRRYFEILNRSLAGIRVI